MFHAIVEVCLGGGDFSNDLNICTKGFAGHVSEVTDRYKQGEERERERVQRERLRLGKAVSI